MRLAFFGTSSFAVPALRTTAEAVVLVVTQPPRPSGRGRQLTYSPVWRTAESLGIEVCAPEKASDPAFIERIRAMKCDALIVASYGQILKQDLLDSAHRGGINLHGSILPRHRGAAPVQWTILSGDAEAGVTLMQMDRGLDTGDIIAIARTEIGPDETAGELEERLSELASDLLCSWMPHIRDGDYPRIPQDESLATLARKLSRADGALDLASEARDAYNRFRACNPRPGAFIQTRFGALSVHEMRLQEGSGGQIATVRYKGGGDLVLVGTGADFVLKSVQLPGKRRVTGEEFANGVRLRVGDSLV